MSKLYICATPIGNLEDITLRALRILKEVDVIAAEDTRHTKKLLNKHRISTTLTSYHKFNIREKTKYILNLIKEGKSAALVSDAGMPGISDPGYELIKEAIKEGIAIVPIPGPTASITALASSGLPTDCFAFEGFLPAKEGERVKVLNRLKDDSRTLIFYEAPHRLVKMLQDLKKVFGSRKVVLARELTKKFEEFVRGSIEELLSKFETKKPKGEFVVIVEGKREVAKKIKEELLLALIKDLLKLGISRKDTVKIVCKYSGLTRNQIYDMVLSLQEAQSGEI